MVSHDLHFLREIGVQRWLGLHEGRLSRIRAPRQLTKHTFPETGASPFTEKILIRHVQL